MTNEEFNLSEKIENLTGFGICGRDNDYIPKKDVKQFIEELKKKIFDNRMYADMTEDEFWKTSTISPEEAEKRAKYQEELIDEIDKLAGEKLR